MTAPTARMILKQLDAQDLGAQLAALGKLDTAHQAEVRRALSAVKGAARIDLPMLIETARESVRHRESQLTAEDREFIRASLDRWREECLRRGVTGAARYGLMLEMQQQEADAAGIDNEIDDLDDEIEGAERPSRSVPRRRRETERRSIKRLRSKRERQPKTKPDPNNNYYLGPRAFDQFGPLTREPFVPMRPPWLLDDGDEDEDELLDDETEGEADAAAATA